MGNSKCCPCDNIDTIENNTIFSRLYYSFIDIIIKLRDNGNNNFSDEIYLVNTKSIPNFIKEIEESKILENLNEDKEKEPNSIEKELIDKNKNYKLEEEGIKFYSDYRESQNISERENDENEFIIFNSNYFGSLEKYKNKKVELIVKRNQPEIKFLASGFNLKIKEKRKGIFKFIKEQNNMKNNIEFNPRTVVRGN